VSPVKYELGNYIPEDGIPESYLLPVHEGHNFFLCDTALI
jgi:hypothetical protein